MEVAGIAFKAAEIFDVAGRQAQKCGGQCGIRNFARIVIILNQDTQTGSRLFHRLLVPSPATMRRLTRRQVADVFSGIGQQQQQVGPLSRQDFAALLRLCRARARRPAWRPQSHPAVALQPPPSTRIRAPDRLRRPRPPMARPPRTGLGVMFRALQSAPAGIAESSGA